MSYKKKIHVLWKTDTILMWSEYIENCNKIEEKRMNKFSWEVKN